MVVHRRFLSGDINNMKSQRKRGGGGLVFPGAAVHAAFWGLIHTDDAIAPNHT